MTIKERKETISSTDLGMATRNLGYHHHLREKEGIKEAGMIQIEEVDDLNRIKLVVNFVDIFLVFQKCQKPSSTKPV